MSERMLNALAAQKINDDFNNSLKARMVAESTQILNEAAAREEAKLNAAKKKKVLVEFKTFVRNTLLESFIEDLVKPAVKYDTLEFEEQNLLHNLTKQFVNESGGAYSILAKAKERTYLLNSLAEAVNDKTEEIYTKTDKQDLSNIGISKDDIDDFVKAINKEDNISKVKELIASRVTSAEAEFVNSNAADQEHIEEIIKTAQEKINKTNTDDTMDDNTKEAINNEAANLSKQAINNIRENKQRSVFDEMVHRFSKSIMKSDGLRNVYCENSGSLNIHKVVNTVKCMYSILEAFAITKMEKIDEAYITNMLNEL